MEGVTVQKGGEERGREDEARWQAVVEGKNGFNEGERVCG